MSQKQNESASSLAPSTQVEPQEQRSDELPARRASQAAILERRGRRQAARCGVGTGRRVDAAHDVVSAASSAKADWEVCRGK